MKLKPYWIPKDQLQDYLDKYQDKIKFITHCINYSGGGTGPDSYLLVIDES